MKDLANCGVLAANYRRFLGFSALVIMASTVLPGWTDRIPLTEPTLAPITESAEAARPSALPANGMAAQAAPARNEAAQSSVGNEAEFNEGVLAYRQGNYAKAQSAFEKLHHQYPESVKITYYLAISEAQLGRFQQARTFYEEIIALAPNGKAADMAKKGLQYLPALSELDPPPRFQSGSVQPNAAGTAMAGSSPYASTPAMGNTSPSAMQGYNPQDLMMMQMMMGQNGKNGGSGFNPMSWMMLPGMMQQNGTNGANYDPNMMSNMMMNQMLQNMDLTGGSDDNH